MTDTQITQQSATGLEILDIVLKMEKLFEGMTRSHVLMACLAESILLQHPGITPTDLSAGIKGASEWIAMYLGTTELPSEPTPNSQLN